MATRAIRSPVALEVLTPPPRTRISVPEEEPAGTLTVAVLPSIMGTSTTAPRMDSETVTGSVTTRSFPSREYTGCGLTVTATSRSPAGPPCTPGLPWPLTRTFWPSLMPAGIRTLIGEPPTLMVSVAPLRA